MNISSFDTRDNYKSLWMFKILELRAPDKWPHLKLPTHQWSLCVMLIGSPSPEWASVEISLSSTQGSFPSSNWQITYGLDTGSSKDRERKGLWLHVCQMPKALTFGLKRGRHTVDVDSLQISIVKHQEQNHKTYYIFLWNRTYLRKKEQKYCISGPQREC